YIGNGRLGVVVPPLGVGASRSYVAGLYEQAGRDVPRIVSIPAWNAITIFNGSRWLNTEKFGSGEIAAYNQSVDMRTGIARTSYQWVAGARRTGVQVQAFVSRADPAISVLRVAVTPLFKGRAGVRFAIVGWPPPRRLPLGTQRKMDPSWTPSDIWYPGHMIVRSRQAVRSERGARLSVTSAPEGRSTLLSQVAELRWGELQNPGVRSIAEGDSALVEITFDAVRGRTYEFTQVSSAVPQQGSHPLTVATRMAQSAAGRGIARLLDEHTRAWARRWESDIVIEGEPELQRVVRSMLFYLLCSADSATAIGIPPMGLSGAGYYGHIFWDSDTWMFPSLLLTHPDIARSLVEFRSRTLPSARANARANNFRGAMYPWEADELGRETTP
ncbi:MAG TPA: hypothetical protein VIM84_16150, partial [Gemmatimonadales bacterium]